MPLTFYLWLHLAGLGLLLLALGGMALIAGERNRMLAAAHGVGMLISLVSGFGLLAKAGIHWPWPGWVWGKILLWLVLGAAPAAMRRMQGRAGILFWGLWALFLLTSWLAVHKPF